MVVVNLTPHAIVLQRENGEQVAYEPSGSVARVVEDRSPEGALDGFPITGIATRHIDWGVDGLKSSEAYIVSRAVAEAWAHTGDGRHMPGMVVAPDTGEGAVRDENGRIVAVRGFVCFED